MFVMHTSLRATIHHMAKACTGCSFIYILFCNGKLFMNAKTKIILHEREVYIDKSIAREPVIRGTDLLIRISHSL